MSKTKTTPADFVEYVDGGSAAVITLAAGLVLNGAKVMTVRMREPELRDELASDAMGGSAAVKEVALFANLCELAPADLHGMKSRDYRRLVAAFTGFAD